MTNYVLVCIEGHDKHSLVPLSCQFTIYTPTLLFIMLHENALPLGYVNKTYIITSQKLISNFWYLL